MKYKETDYAELKELCLELGIPYMESFIDIEYAIDQDKEPKHLWEKPQRCHSWVRNAYNQMMACLGGLNLSDASPGWGTGYMNIKDSGGTIRSGGTVGFVNNRLTENLGIWIRANTNVVTYGILVGSNSAAESFEHYGLQTTLTVNQTHAAMGAPAFAQDGLISKTSYSRKITNATGGQITYRECGLFAIISLGGGVRNTLLSRDLIIPELTLNNTGFLTPTYTIALTYPS